MNRSILSGLTRKGRFSAPVNPQDTSPVAARNRVTLEVVRRGRSKARVVHEGNILVTNGLSRLAQLLVTGGEASTQWVNAMQIGTSSTAESSTQTALGASTAIVHLSQASMSKSDASPRTSRWYSTFVSSNPAGAASINEVGLFFTTTAATTMIARSMLGTDSVNKGASDQINISYDVVFTTA